MPHIGIATLIGGAAIATLSACATAPCDTALSSNRPTALVQLSACTDTLDPTPSARMPNVGQATYVGLISGSIQSPTISDDTIIGDATLTADFAALTLTGTMDNFSSTDQGDLGGTLTLSGGTISGNSVVVPNLSGNLTGYGSGKTMSVATIGAGGFAGSNADALVISTTGAARFSGNPDNASVTMAVVARK